MKKYFALGLFLLSPFNNILSKTISPQKFNFITSLYNETNNTRAQEYITCLERNRAHSSINEIHVIYDTSKDDNENRILCYLHDAGISITYVVGRPSYGFSFDLANSMYPNSRVIVSNADIFFNETLSLLEGFDLKDRFLAITRWDVLENGDIVPHERYGKTSQDVWIFETPLRPFNNHHIYLGEIHHNVILTYEALRSGLEILNPCKTIQCCHLHLSDLRHYDSTIPFPKNGHTMALHWIYLDKIQQQ